jgi:hypothetical protein
MIIITIDDVIDPDGKNVNVYRSKENSLAHCESVKEMPKGEGLTHKSAIARSLDISLTQSNPT